MQNAVSLQLKEFAAWVTARSLADGGKLLKSYYASRSQKGAGNFCGTARTSCGAASKIWKFWLRPSSSSRIAAPLRHWLSPVRHTYFLSPPAPPPNLPPNLTSRIAATLPQR